MKLRLNKQSLRLRLSKDDLKQLKERGEILESLTFSAESQLSYSLILSKNSERLVATFESSHIQIFLPKELGLNWLSSEDVSLEEKNDSLKILVEKDLPCDHRGKETSYDRQFK